MLWRPRSILQLMLFGLITVVAPLCVAIFYTVQTLDELARQNQSVNQQTISLTRSSQVFESSLLDLERRAGQYVALGDNDLLDLFVHEREQLLITLRQIESTLVGVQSDAGSSMRSTQQQLYDTLQSVPDSGADLAKALSSFEQLADGSAAFRDLVQSYVDQQLDELGMHAEDIQQSLMLMVALLAVLTFAFSLLLIYWINTPIKQLERQIRQLGRGDMSQEIRISGPSEIQLLGTQLEWLRTRLDELEKEKLQFLRHMSHELKTPLASLREGADLLAEGVAGELLGKQQEVVDIIQANSRELQRLIENLLDYNQMIHSQHLLREPLALQDLWQELIAAHQMTIERKGLQVSLDGDIEQWPVDEKKFTAVLDNLMSNAVNYSPLQGRINIHWRVEHDNLMMEVANSGETISDVDKDKIFDPFYQGSNSRHGPIKGSGIGLSVARECMQAHGGSLSLVEHPVLAVCFHLECPGLEKKQ
ncbi:MAG: HAMP domain-containing sensor histidine kinase [Pseudomonadales bacterium]